jgi:hypothetical protein
MAGRFNDGTGGSGRILLIPQVRRWVIFYSGNVWAIPGKNSTPDNFRRKGSTAWPHPDPIGINGTEPGLQVEHFAGRIGIVDFTLIIELFITATPAATALVFPGFSFCC